MSVDWEAIRAQFPALRNWVYLDTATFGQLPSCASEAIACHCRRRDHLGCTDFLSWFDDADRLREKCARLVHATAADVAFFPNAATALSLFLGGIAWRPGDRVVTLANEFPNNLYHPALLACRGVEFIETPWEGFAALFEKPVRAVLVSTVNYSTGLRPPMDEVVRAARQAGAFLFIDGTQSAGALDFDAARWEPDMYAVDGYKWLLCPNGASFAYIHPRFRQAVAPQVVGWRSHKGWRRVDNLHHGAPEFVEEAEKYEGGMLPFPVLYGMEGSLDLILGLGIQRIESRVLELARQLRALLASLGAELLASPCESNVVAARFAGADMSALARRLRSRRVVVSARHGCLRVSAHFYNNSEDLEALAAALRAEL